MEHFRCPYLLAILSISLIVPAPAVSASEVLETPDPPEGFEWVWLPEINGAFLKPQGWHFRAEEHAETLGYFFSKESISKEGEFFSGLTVNVVRDAKQRTGQTAQDYAKSFIATVAQSDQNEILEAWEHGVSTLQSYGVRVLSLSNPDRPTIIHYLAIGNSSTDTLYVLFFEAPEATWSETWKIGEVMLRLFLIDDEV